MHIMVAIIIMRMPWNRKNGVSAIVTFSSMNIRYESERTARRKLKYFSNEVATTIKNISLW